MLMPGRRGYLQTGGSSTGVGGGSGSGLPADIGLSERNSNQPAEYKATNSIEFVDGFVSGSGDEFVAYITTEQIGGGGSGSYNWVMDGSAGYRYGFGGHEKSDEISGTGNSYTAEFWQYDPRLARRWNVDPLFKDYESPYSTFGNNPILNIDPTGADTAKYLTNAQIVDAIKIGFNIINNDVRNKSYNASKDVSSRIEAEIEKYWDNHQADYSFNGFAEFRIQVYEYHKGLKEVATRSAVAWDRLEQRINNPSLNDKTNIIQTYATIQYYNGSTLNLVVTSANLALGLAAGSVGIGPGKGPVGPRINSSKQQEIVDIGIRNSVPKNIHSGQQGKHIIGHGNYQEGKSILTENAQTLLNEFHAGKATILRQPNANRIVVDFNKPIGTYINPQTNVSVSTTKGIINFGKNGAHIVPSNPN